MRLRKILTGISQAETDVEKSSNGVLSPQLCRVRGELCPSKFVAHFCLRSNGRSGIARPHWTTPDGKQRLCLAEMLWRGTLHRVALFATRRSSWPIRVNLQALRVGGRV